MATHSSILAWRIPMDRAAWWATVHRITNSWTQVKWLSTYSSSNNLLSTIQALYPQLGSEERDKVSVMQLFGQGTLTIYIWNGKKTFLQMNEYILPFFLPSFAFQFNKYLCARHYIPHSTEGNLQSSRHLHVCFEGILKGPVHSRCSTNLYQ